MNELNWDDLRIFILVARHGGLAGAASAVRSSSATIGRRMLALERATGRSLFNRSNGGYQLTDDGKTLLRKAIAMEANAKPIDDWLSTDTKRPVVRISAGTWTASFIAENISRIWSRNDAFRICFKATEARLDIAHREAEIGVRNQPADQNGLASRKTVAVAFAPFKARNHPDADGDDWVAVGSDEAVTRSARWLLQQDGMLIGAYANTPFMVRELVRAGAGKAVIPCFAGDRDPTLSRAGPTIDELSENQWLVMHDDDRHRPEVRTVIDRLSSLFADHASLFGGDRPIGAAQTD